MRLKTFASTLIIATNAEPLSGAGSGWHVEIKFVWGEREKGGRGKKVISVNLPVPGRVLCSPVPMHIGSRENRPTGHAPSVQ